MAERSAVVADTGPLIALGRIDGLDWISLLADRIYLTPTVVAELQAKPDAPESAAIDAWLRSPRVSIASPTQPESWRPSRTLGPGELSCLRLAQELSVGDRTVLLLVDDLRGRAEARAGGLSITGTAGLVAAVRRAGAVPSARSCLNAIRLAGYYLSDAVIDAACRSCGE